jgi:hypothetical protein
MTGSAKSGVHATGYEHPRYELSITASLRSARGQSIGDADDVDDRHANRERKSLELDQ